MRASRSRRSGGRNSIPRWRDERLDEPALPAPLLGERGAQSLRCRRRGDRLRDECEPVGQASVAAVAVQSKGQLEILARDAAS